MILLLGNNVSFVYGNHKRARAYAYEIIIYISELGCLLQAAEVQYEYVLSDHQPFRVLRGGTSKTCA